jgi:hypothetical protein
VVFSRKINNSTYTFGISGRLYKSNVLLYDHQTESLWSQLMEKAISGPLVRSPLVKIPSKRIKWKSWLKKYPATLVLSDKTGYERNYSIDPYKGYYRIGTLLFPVGKVRKDLSGKQRVLGIVIHGKAKAYPLLEITRERGVIQDTIDGTTIHIKASKEKEIISVKDDKGSSVPHIFSYWFAWQAFHPDTTVYTAD